MKSPASCRRQLATSITTPGTFAEQIAPLAARYGLRKRDGYGLLRWLYDLVGDAEREIWLKEAREWLAREASE